MTVYVENLLNRGWKMNGHDIKNCHMFTDTLDLAELHRIAAAAGMKRSWFQNKAAAPHYNLTPKKRQLAIQAGAVPVDTRDAVMVWRARRELVAGTKENVS